MRGELVRDQPDRGGGLFPFCPLMWFPHTGTLLALRCAALWAHSVLINPDRIRGFTCTAREFWPTDRHESVHHS